MIDKADEMRCNLLYEYSQILCGHRERFSSLVIGNDPSIRHSNAVYLMSFILKHILMLQSREEALQYIKDNPQILQDCRLEILIRNDYIQIGNTAIKDYDYAFRLVYGEIKSVDDVMNYLKETTRLKKCIKEKVIKELSLQSIS